MLKKIQAQVPPPNPKYVTVKGAAAYLCTTVWFIRSLIYAKKIPAIKLGNRYVFDTADLDVFVNSLKSAA
jgi:excisionase family DNA binding protein